MKAHISRLLFFGNNHNSGVGQQVPSENYEIDISSANFAFNFNSFDDNGYIIHFRLSNCYVKRIVKAVPWPGSKVKTGRNGYLVDLILATCVVLCRLAVSTRLLDLEDFFGKHRSALSEIFSYLLEVMKEVNGHRLLTKRRSKMIYKRANMYAASIHEKRGFRELLWVCR